METTEIKANELISLTREEFLKGKEFYVRIRGKVYTLKVYKKEKLDYITETINGEGGSNYTCSIEEVGKEGVYITSILLTDMVRGYTKFEDMISKERYKED